MVYWSELRTFAPNKIMQIIEQNIIAKSPERKCEDGLVITDDFIAVIDGSTSKSTLRHSLFRSNGRYCMQLVSKYLRHAPKNISCDQFCRGVTAYVNRHYRRSRLSLLSSQPEERMCASAIVFSRVNREIWMIGDCQCLVGGELYENPKPYERVLAEERADIILHMSSTKGLLEHDIAREQIIPHMKEWMKRQNKDYAVIDGFPIPMQHVRIITLDFQPWEIVLASDGYPWLCPTLQESEERLAWQRTHDPLNIGDFKATKGFMQGCESFDDRIYVRFKV